MNSLFGMDNVALRKSEIYINKKKGANCSFHLNSTNKWLLGNFIINQFKTDEPNVAVNALFELINGQNF